MAKVSAENSRLQQGNREEERRNRQSAYHDFLDALTAIYQALGSAVQKQRRNEITNNYNHLLSGVVLFGPPRVREAATDVQLLMREIWAAEQSASEEHPEQPDPDRWRDATVGFRNEFSAKFTRLVDVMHKDVTRGITEDAEQPAPEAASR